MLKKQHMCYIILIVAIFFVLVDQANSTEPHSDYGVPKLGKTVFIPNTAIDNPFINTRIRTTLGFGQTSNLLTPILYLNDNPIVGLEGDLIYALLEIEYQYAVQDWMAIWGQV